MIDALDLLRLAWNDPKIISLLSADPASSTTSDEADFHAIFPSLGLELSGSPTTVSAAHLGGDGGDFVGLLPAGLRFGMTPIEVTNAIGSAPVRSQPTTRLFRGRTIDPWSAYSFAGQIVNARFRDGRLFKVIVMIPEVFPTV